MDDLKKILTEYEAQPSAGSWEKLSHRLDAVMPVGEASSAAQAASGAKGLLGSTAAKITAAVIGAAVVATAVVATVMATHNNDAANSEPPLTSATATADTVISEEVSTPVESNEATTNYSVETPIEQTSQTVSSPAQENPVAQAPGNPTQNTASSTPKETKSASAPTAAAPSTIGKPVAPTRTNITRASIPANSTIIQNIQKDPVIQSRSDQDFTWTQPEKIEIPNVFTPNGDGYNDNFTIKGLESCNKKQLIIRNRSGKIVFSTKLYENNWNGGDCPDGVYSYQFLFNNGGMDQTMSGTVTIMRK